jgi:hypothetical protein
VLDRPGAALAIPSAAHRIRLDVHQRLREHGDHCPQQIRACLGQLLLQPARHVNTCSDGHRVAPHHRDLWSELNEDHAVAASHYATLNSGNIKHHISGRNSSQ